MRWSQASVRNWNALRFLQRCCCDINWCRNPWKKQFPSPSIGSTSQSNSHNCWRTSSSRIGFQRIVLSCSSCSARNCNATTSGTDSHVRSVCVSFGFLPPLLLVDLRPFRRPRVCDVDFAIGLSMKHAQKQQHVLESYACALSHNGFRSRT